MRLESGRVPQMHPHDEQSYVPSSSTGITKSQKLTGSGGRRWRLRQEPEPSVVRVHDRTQRLATDAEVRVFEAVLREVLLVRAHASELRELVEVVHEQRRRQISL